MYGWADWAETVREAKCLRVKGQFVEEKEDCGGQSPRWIPNQHSFFHINKSVGLLIQRNSSDQTKASKGPMVRSPWPFERPSQSAVVSGALQVQSNKTTDLKLLEENLNDDSFFIEIKENIKQNDHQILKFEKKREKKWSNKRVAELIGLVESKWEKKNERFVNWNWFLRAFLNELFFRNIIFIWTLDKHAC